MAVTTISGAPVALRISVTDRCQLRCLYCWPGHLLRRPPPMGDLAIADMVRFVTVAQRTLGVSKIRLTGGEPLLRTDVVEITRALALLGVPDLGLTTNGQRLARLAGPLRAAGLRRVNISLDSLDRNTFARMASGGELRRSLAGIETALAVDLTPVRINSVILRGINDHEVESLVDHALALGCEPRFIELMRTGLTAARHASWFVSSQEVRDRLSSRFELSPLPPVAGSSSRRYLARSPKGQGVVGFISPDSHPFCQDCNRLRLTADGRLFGCLARDEHRGLMPLLRSRDPGAEEQLASALRAALTCKRSSGPFSVGTPMSSLGG
jgi:GTP 3',8-cyclase